MQAIIMAAGKGRRLGRFSDSQPKSFMEIKGVPLIDYNIALLRSVGVNDIIIVTGYQYALFEHKYGSKEFIELIYNPFYEYANVIGSFWAGMHLLHGEFIFAHADSICDIGIISDLAAATSDIVLPVDFAAYDDEAMGVRCVNGMAVEINKKIPIGSEETGEFIGYVKISKNMLPHVKEEVINLLKQNEHAEYFEASIQKLMDKQKYDIATLSTNGRFWAEIDFIEDYEKAIREIPDSLVELARALS